ncbi:MAG: NAD(P)(+) transhydrogenase (Re/Si-specific) subunit beta, partial [Microlunatus sp.]|nr:NAD(P)(+) transhydrogenase (Re/Si-specific) subunit beta [Microlunatus sp.]
AAASFVLGLHWMNSPATARRGNRLSMAGMAVAILATVAVLINNGSGTLIGMMVLILGLAVGGIAGLFAARRVRMTAMPQLVSVFNAVGGGAAALIALSEAVDHVGWTTAGNQPFTTTVATSLDLLIGGLTFSGSLIAAGKLAGVVAGHPVRVPAGRTAIIGLAVIGVAGAVAYIAGWGGLVMITTLTAAALALGIIVTVRIGGADMPVVISLLNACTGTAVAMAGFVINSLPLIIAGALVGAAGGILTNLMAVAMNRSLVSIIAGGYGTGDQQTVTTGAGDVAVHEVTADDASLQLAYAHKVIIVPGYGLAAAQAQHEVVRLARSLADHGVQVSYGIHPVAGRMPGHMNVLLAEADAPYTELKDLDEINPEFPDTDVVLVVGANDVTNPAARRPGNAVSGMPILDVDRARRVIVIKRSLGHGYAGIDNELYVDPKTAMLFGDAKTMLADLLAGLRAYIH